MFVADYVLMEYGTGALMAVPAHDDRDHAFARPRSGSRSARWCAGGDDVQAEPYIGDGPLVNSGRFDGEQNREAYGAIVAWLESEGKGEPAVNYRLRDWLLSRQRYWGCPIPIVYCESDGIVAVPDDQLPVELPDVEDYAPKGQSPLAAVDDWVNTDVPEVRRPSPARDRHDGHLRRLVVVLPALPRPAQHLAAVRPRGRGLLDAGRQLHRRGRARDPAPDVRALLHQGARGHGDARRAGAVRPPVHPGDDHDGRGEDVLVQGQHRQRRPRRSSATAPTPPARTSCFLGPPERGGDWVAEGVEGVHRFLVRLWRLANEVDERTGPRVRPTACPPRARRATCSPRRTGRSTRRPTTCGRFSCTRRSPR